METHASRYAAPPARPRVCVCVCVCVCVFAGVGVLSGARRAWVGIARCALLAFASHPLGAVCASRAWCCALPLDSSRQVAPPLRDAANRRKLWGALIDGSVTSLASDHTPATLEERAGSFFDAFTGISGLQFTLPATWTEGREHGASLQNLSKWLSEEPAKLAGIWKRKGSIEAGKDADLVIWRPDARTETAAVFHRQPGSPYEDLPLQGRVVSTVLRGRVVFRDSQQPLATCGQVVSESQQPESGG